MASIICTLTGGSMEAIVAPPIQFYFNYNYIQNNFTLSPGITGYQQILDSIYSVQRNAIYAQYYSIVPYLGNNSTPSLGYSYSSSNSNVAYISGNSIYYKTSGTAYVTITSQDSFNNRYSLNTTYFNFTSSGGTSLQMYVSAAPNTARLAATSAVDTRITNVYPNSALNLFTTINNPVSTFVRNPNVWTKDVDVTCISPWNNSVGFPGGQTGTGTLITPRHYILAAHFQIPVGTQLAFVDNSNNVCVI